MSIPLGSTKTPIYKKINVAREAGKIFGVAWLIFHSNTRFILPIIMVQAAHRTICPDLEGAAGHRPHFSSMLQKAACALDQKRSPCDRINFNTSDHQSARFKPPM